MNCWEFKKCGREATGAKVEELGTCPVYPEHGTHCGFIVGTLCGGTVQGTFAAKLNNCLACDYFKSEYYDHTYKPKRTS